MNAYALQQYAKTLKAKADEASRLAAQIEALPDPIGDAIVDVVALLSRHGLCVISRDALREVSDLLTQAELEDTQDWDSATQSSVMAVHASLQRVSA